MSDSFSDSPNEGPYGRRLPDDAAAPGGSGESGPYTPPPPHPARAPFPWARLLYAIGFAVLAWVMFWLLVLVLAPLFFITLAISGKENEELKRISLRALHYLLELLAFISGVSEEKPFPFGPFPSG